MLPIIRARGTNHAILSDALRVRRRSDNSYTSVVLVFTHAAGPDTRENAYLAAGPLRPGESAELRAALPEPPFTHVSLTLREAGQPVTVEPQTAG